MNTAENRVDYRTDLLVQSEKLTHSEDDIDGLRKEVFMLYKRMFDDINTDYDMWWKLHDWFCAPLLPDDESERYPFSFQQCALAVGEDPNQYQADFKRRFIDHPRLDVPDNYQYSDSDIEKVHDYLFKHYLHLFEHERTEDDLWWEVVDWFLTPILPADEAAKFPLLYQHCAADVVIEGQKIDPVNFQEGFRRGLKTHPRYKPEMRQQATHQPSLPCLTW